MAARCWRPGRPTTWSRSIDVRDLAAWILDAAEGRTTGAFDGVGEIKTLAQLLGEVAAGVGPEPSFTWVDSDFLSAQDVQPWAGEGSIPLWLPRPEYDGMMSHSPEPAIAAGLRLRPVADTARDALGETAIGIGADRERELLEAWHAREVTAG